jgi:hypothetical protein
LVDFAGILANVSSVGWPPICDPVSHAQTPLYVGSSPHASVIATMRVRTSARSSDSVRRQLPSLLGRSSIVTRSVVAPVSERLSRVCSVSSVNRKKKYRRRGDVVLASLLTSSSLAFKRVQAGAKRRASERAKRRSAGEWMEASTHPRIVGQGGTRTRVHTHAAARASIGTHGTACPQRVQRLLPPACAACRVACRWGCQDPPEGGFCGGVTLRYPP